MWRGALLNSEEDRLGRNDKINWRIIMKMTILFGHLYSLLQCLLRSLVLQFTDQNYGTGEPLKPEWYLSCPIILLATISIQDHVRDGAEPEFNNIAELLCSSSSPEQLNSCKILYLVFLEPHTRICPGMH